MKRNCRSKEVGGFSCNLVEGVMTLRGTANWLKLNNKKHNDTVEVPEFMLKEARKTLKSGKAADILNLHYLCCVHEAGVRND